MKKINIRKWIDDEYPGKIVMDGYDDCILGVVERFGHDAIVCYDRQKVILKLMKDGMSEEEAIEYYDYNQLGAYVGDNTPCFLIRPE